MTKKTEKVLEEYDVMARKNHVVHSLMCRKCVEVKCTHVGLVLTLEVMQLGG
jgi:hypothetical protein